MTLALFVQWLKLGKDLFSQLPNATTLNFLPQRHCCHICSSDTGSKIVLTCLLSFRILSSSIISTGHPAFRSAVCNSGSICLRKLDTCIWCFHRWWCCLSHCFFMQPLQPHVRVWDSVSLVTLQVIGLGTFERGVGCLDFSKAVRWALFLGVLIYPILCKREGDLWTFCMWLSGWSVLVLKVCQ